MRIEASAPMSRLCPIGKENEMERLDIVKELLQYIGDDAAKDKALAQSCMKRSKRMNKQVFYLATGFSYRPSSDAGGHVGEYATLAEWIRLFYG